MARDKVELWIRHQEAPTELEDLVFCNDLNQFWCVQTRLPAIEYAGDFDSVMSSLVRAFQSYSWNIKGHVCWLYHGDLIVVPGHNVGLVYASYVQTLDLGRLKGLSCEMGPRWACMDLGKFLGPRDGNPLSAVPSEFVNDVKSDGVIKGFPGL